MQAKEVREQKKRKVLKNNQELKTGVHILLALAFVPVEKVPRLFELLVTKIIVELLPILKYF